ncbi:MAG: bifunctional nuclease domain-containing protein [Bacteroidia bacterium]
MDKIKLNVLGLSTGHKSGSYTLILGGEDSNIRLPIVIGSFEAQAIAIEIEKIVPFRPMTHDLFLNFFKEFNIELIEVQIYSLNEGVFHAKLVCEQLGIIKELEARASDSIALAVRFKCPIYTFEDIMEEAGIIVDASDEETVNENFSEQNNNTNSPNDLSKASLENLHILLNDALKIEDYVLAAKIRDEIDLRK